MIAPSRPHPRFRARWFAALIALLGGLLLLPAAPPVAARPADASIVPEIWRVPPGKGQVALTFDGDAFGGRVSEILADLQTYHAHATFFLTGHYLLTFPVRSHAIAQAGQEIASHGYYHQDYRGLSDGAIIRSLDAWSAAYHNMTGKWGPPFWRAPSGASDNRVRLAATSAGYSTIGWTLDSLDTVGPPKSAAFVFNRLTQTSVRLDGAILLLHVNPNGTVDALPRVLAELRRYGLSIVTVSTLLAP